ncbi:hypothetical protein [Rubellimicrobium aerolatum]|uniref:Uncharacterized protein n=1 Tax=Rubellimicrobium aerolatum TaxID=490979 RepID=A0ABW0S7Z9_9RHOB|nr:hypothetical protein [Rubellimicrobium aerolatum]MBP1804399.1 hypothetical protein [Rubellimicrobium aerolatum]
MLTHHKLLRQGTRTLALGGESEALKPMAETGSGGLPEKEKARLAEIVDKLNDLSHGEVTDDDRLIYVNSVLKGKLLENEMLAQQAASNTKEQSASSPALGDAILDAIMDAFEAHTSMSRQALDSAEVRQGLKQVLLGPVQLYEGLRARQHGTTAQDPGR